MTDVAGPSGDPPPPPKRGPPKRGHATNYRLDIERKRAEAQNEKTDTGHKGPFIAHPGFYPGLFEMWPLRNVMTSAGQPYIFTPVPLPRGHRWPCEVDGTGHWWDGGFVPQARPLSDFPYRCNVEGFVLQEYGNQCRKCGKIVCNSCREADARQRRTPGHSCSSGQRRR